MSTKLNELFEAIGIKIDAQKTLVMAIVEACNAAMDSKFNDVHSAIGIKPEEVKTTVVKTLREIGQNSFGSILKYKIRDSLFASSNQDWKKENRRASYLR